MKRHIIALGMMVWIMIFCIPALAQNSSGQSCDPEAINTTANELIAVYSQAQKNASDTASALEAVDTLGKALDNLHKNCANATVSAGSTEESPGSGTRSDPFAFGVNGDTGEGSSLQLIGFIGSANTAIRNENMFNDRPKDDEVYIIVSVAVMCQEDNDTGCEVSQYNFQMVGDKGIVYDIPFVVYDDMIDVNVLGGTRGEGNLVFLVKKDDTNLRLIYRSNMFSKGTVYFSAQPSLANGIQITGKSNVNVRTGPGTNFGVAGNLAANTSTIAFGRNGDGTWLQITEGWVFSELVDIAGDVQSLPVTSQ